MQQVRLGVAKPLISFSSARYCPRDRVHTLKELQNSRSPDNEEHRRVSIERCPVNAESSLPPPMT